MYLLFDLANQQVAGQTAAADYVPVAGQVVAPAPAGYTEADAQALVYEDGVLRIDAVARLARLKQTRITEVKQQAAAAIEALSWRLERARERGILGVAGESEAQVLREREAIRAASNRAEALVAAALDEAAVAAVALAVGDGDSPAGSTVSRIDLLRRFTSEEMTAIVAASKTDAAIAAMLMMWQVVDVVYLPAPETIAGVQALEAAGLIGEGRAAEILGG